MIIHLDDEKDDPLCDYQKWDDNPLIPFDMIRGRMISHFDGEKDEDNPL